MKLDKLVVRGSKNLENFEIDFDETRLTTVLVGENGSGKSNLLEVIVRIFQHLDNPKSIPDFSYELSYWIRQSRVTVSYEEGVDAPASLSVTDSKNKKIASGSFTNRYKASYFPTMIFGYYSGVSKRLEGLFERYEDEFEENMRRISSGQSDERGEIPFRSFFFARNYHSQYVLLSLLVDPNKKVQEFIKQELNIAELDSVLFVLKAPRWSDAARRAGVGDPRFWYARGLVNNFLSDLFTISLAPLFLPNKETPEYLYLYLHNPEALRNLVKNYGGLKDVKTHKAFFNALDLTYISELMEKIIIRVRLSNSNQVVSFDELSEGEQQLLTVLGLLRLTKEDESLFLLDEPDTHLNPSWSIKYLQILEDIGVVDEDSKSHIIMTTHNPMTISALKREQVQIMFYDEKSSSIKADIPFVDPVGRGIAGLLTSEIFRLSEPVDVITAAKLEERRKLVFEMTSSDISARKKKKITEQLKELDAELENVNFASFTQDRDYLLFTEALKKYEEEMGFGKKDLTPDDIQRLQEYAFEEIKRIKAELKN
jgi:predicted ATPase